MPEATEPTKSTLRFEMIFEPVPSSVVVEPGPTVTIPSSPIVFTEAKIASLPASSQLDAGLRAYESRDYVKALKSWLPVADSGNANAQFYVGGLFRDGAGVPTDLPRAHLWWSLAAKITPEVPRSSL